MPTVLVVAGFRCFFFSNEGTEPPHIHVARMKPGGGGGYAKFWLAPVSLAASRMARQDLRRVRELVVEHQSMLRERWREYFGED